jgi:signal recognition particle subunit SRP54
MPLSFKPVFDSLSDRLNATLTDLRSRGRLSEEDVATAMREIRLALLEADVNFKVVREFVAKVRERAVGEGVLTGLNPGQQVIKIVNEELAALMGTGAAKLAFRSSPSVILMAGLQGSGKTTTSGKLAKLLAKQGRKPALVACDVYRPAAIEQLKTVGGQVGVPVFDRGTDVDPVEIATWGVQQARQQGRDTVIVDTAGRLHVDDDLMRELVRIRDAVKPDTTLLVLDSMTGQDAVNVAETFREQVQFDGIVMTKLDGDARGGAALSVRAVTGMPILFASVGEKLDQLEEFHPDRMASRILGMGDVLSLIERIEESVDRDQAAQMEEKLRKQEFTLDDLLEQLRTIRKMGSLGGLMKMIPGLGKQLRDAPVDDRQLDRVEAIILSMTPEERRAPEIVNGTRRARIARGSGTSVQQINALLQQHRQMKKMMKTLAGGKMPGMPGLPGMPGATAPGVSKKKKKKR